PGPALAERPPAGGDRPRRDRHPARRPPGAGVARHGARERTVARRRGAAARRARPHSLGRVASARRRLGGAPPCPRRSAAHRARGLVLARAAPLAPPPAAVSGPLRAFFATDHDRLDALLRGALAGTGPIDLALFGAFRAGLLRHIGMEEKVLFAVA